MISLGTSCACMACAWLRFGLGPSYTHVVIPCRRANVHVLGSVQAYGAFSQYEGASHA